MSAIVLGAASMTLNAANAIAFQIDEEKETFNASIKKITDYFIYTCHAQYFLTYLHYFFLNKDLINLPLSDLMTTGLNITIFSYITSIVSISIITYFSNKNLSKNNFTDLNDNEFNELKKNISLNYNGNFRKKIVILASIVTNLTLLAINPKFSVVSIVSTLFLTKTFYHINKQQWIAVAASTFRKILHPNPLNPSSENLSLDKFDIAANLRLRKSSNHFRKKCSICFEKNLAKYFFCTKHIFDLGCILKYFTASLGNFKFSNLTTTKDSHNNIKNISLKLDRTSLPVCPICRNEYHQSEMSIRFLSRSVKIK